MFLKAVSDAVLSESDKFLKRGTLEKCDADIYDVSLVFVLFLHFFSPQPVLKWGLLF